MTKSWRGIYLPLICCYLFSVPSAYPQNDPEKSDADNAELGQTLPTPEEEIRELNEKIDINTSEETSMRQRWVSIQRDHYQAQRQLLTDDEEVKALQLKINDKLKEVAALQSELEQLIVHKSRGTDVADEEVETPQSLQMKMFELRKQREELISQRDRLMRELTAESADAAPVDASE